MWGGVLARPGLKYLLLLLLTAGSANPGGVFAAGTVDSGSGSRTRVHVIEIRGFQYVPAQVEVQVGDTVTWINRDIVPHTVTALDSSWDSGMLRTGEEYAVEVTGETIASYYCVYHPAMKGSLLLLTSGQK